MAAYESASTGAWDDFLTCAAETLSANQVVLLSQEPNQQGVTYYGQRGLTDDALRRYAEYYCVRNVFQVHGSGLRAPGVVRTSETLCTSSALTRSTFYNEYLRPLDLRYAIGVTADRHVQLSAFRGHADTPFSTTEVHEVAALYPHLRRALQLYGRLHDAEQRCRGFQLAFDQTDKGVALLNHVGGVLYLNAALQTTLRAKDGLILTSDMLSASSPSAARTLRKTIQDATGGGRGGTVYVGRTSPGMPYQILVTPVLSQSHATGGAAAIVVVSDPGTIERVADVATLQQSLGLTRAEAVVARRLALGDDLQSISDHLGLSLHTTRTHLKRIFAKTGVHRQSELVHRVLTGSTPGRHSDSESSTPGRD